MATRWLVMTCVVMARCSNASSDLDFFAQHSRKLNQQNHLIAKDLETQRYEDDNNNNNGEKLLIDYHEGWKRSLNSLPYTLPVDFKFLLKSKSKRIDREEEHEDRQQEKGRGWRRQQHRTHRSVQQEQDEVEAACECVRTRCPTMEVSAGNSFSFKYLM